MNKHQLENLFSRLIHRWKTGDIKGFEKDYAEDVIVHFNQDTFGFEELKSRQEYFSENFEVLDFYIKNSVFEEDRFAVRLFVKVKNKESQAELSDHLFWIFKIKNDQISSYRTMGKLNFNFNINIPKSIE